MIYFGLSLSPHVVGILQQSGHAQYPHKCGEILCGNFAEGNLHLVTELVDHPFFIAAQLHGTVKLFFDLRESRLRLGGGAVSDMGLANILNDTIQIIMDRVAEKVAILHLSKLRCVKIRLDVKALLLGAFRYFFRKSKRSLSTVSAR